MPNLIPLEKIENKILLIRGEKVMLDRDLAALYGVETRTLIQSVKRNKERFPDDFIFQLTRIEAEYLISEGWINGSLRSQIVILNDKNGENKANLKSRIVTLKSKRGKHLKYLPYVFTEPGVAMLSSVLRSKKAIEINVIIMRAFIKIRQLVYSYKDLADKVEKIEREHGKKISRIFEILDRLMKDDVKRGEIGFKGK